MLNKKKYIFIIGALSFGGAERVICNLANKFAENNNKVILIALHNREQAYKLQEKVHFVNGLIGQNPLSKAISLRKILKREKASAIISFMTHVNIFTILVNLGLKSNVYISERSNPYIVPRQYSRKLLRNITYPFVKGIVFQTKDAQNYFSQKIQRKSIVIPNPVFLENHSQHAGESKKIVNVGRLIASKRQDLLIKAFKKIHDKFPEYRLEIYGEGPERENLNNLVKNLNLQNSVSLCGVSHELHQKINDAELFVLTSEYEGMPNALMEAMALGIPSISTDCPIGGPRSIIRNMTNGILIPVNNEEEIVNSMQLLISNKDLWKKISLESAKVKKEYSLEKIMTAWQNFLLN